MEILRKLVYRCLQRVKSIKSIKSITGGERPDLRPARACSLTRIRFTMNIKLINIGFGNIVSANRIIVIVSPESAPIKRIIGEARDRGMLVDATYGRRTRAVIITDSGHVILSAVQPETVKHRLQSKEAIAEESSPRE